VRSTNAPPSAEQVESTRLRLTFLALLVVSLFVLLFARLWFLQVMAGEQYTARAAGNAVRTVSIQAPRGRILDRHGEPIVRNRSAAVVSVQPAEMGDRQAEVFADLADLLGMSVEDIQRRVDVSRVNPFRPKPIAIDVPDETLFYIHENSADRYPGVYAETVPLRTYPHGSLAAHVVGYTGEISAEELEQPDYEGYRPGDIVGWAGVERSYERQLRGTDGVRRLEVDARNRVLREIEHTPPVPGNDVRLTIDLRAQQITEEALLTGIEVARTVPDAGTGPGRGGTYKAVAGTALVMDPRTGEIVAMASLPTFEPDAFVGGVSRDYWAFLQDPANHFPLINRAIQSSYPPGSVFKVVSTAAALEEGYLGQGDRLPCPRRFEFGGRTFNNWRTHDRPAMNLLEALVDSCDTVYYELARRMWSDEQREAEGLADGQFPRERLAEHARAWGYGQRQGIDLPGERAGVVPGRQWKREFWEASKDTYCSQARTQPEGSHAQRLYADLCEFGDRWFGGDAVNMSIGQGDVQTTPLQVVNTLAAVANRGTLHRPHVVREVDLPDGGVERREPEVVASPPVSRANLDYIHAGLVGVARPGGTAGSVFGDFPLPAAGKTGTAEFKPKQPIAWFAAYAPADEPQYVVVAMVEEGGGGSQVAAPIVRRILEGLLDVGASEIDPGEKTD
jgi:penicillin-binding protein 2